MRCSVQNCNNDTKKTTKAHGITFHMFPKDKNLRSAWVEALGITDWEPKDRSTVCSEHFRNDDFYVTKGGLRKIKDGAVPVFGCDMTEDIDAPAALRVCRICLAHEGRMYHIRDQKLDQVYERITGIYINEDDKLPQKLCWECAHRLMLCNGFRSKALRSQACLNKIVAQDRYITIRDVKTITRVNDDIKSSLVTKVFDPDDTDLHIKEDQIDVPIKPEVNDLSDDDRDYQDIDNREPETIDEIPIEMPITEEPIVEIPVDNVPMDLEIKDEANEIYFDEYNDSDDKKLSEVYEKPKKVRKKKLKEDKKAKLPKKCDDNTPAGTMDRYKTNDVKRRKTQERPDESLFTITTLSYEEQIAEVQKRQELTSYRCAPYKCTVCYRGFQIRDRYDAHVVRHSEQIGAFECFICKTRLKTARALRKHLTAQHTEKFSCKGCPFVTRNRGVAREHEKWHAGTKYQCPHCPSEFDKITTYMGHIRIKHVSDFVCELCGYTFVSKKGIEVHKKKKHRLSEKTVLLEGPYCEVCDVRFVSDEAHGRHLKLSSRHSSDNDPNRIRNDSQSMNTEKHGRIIRKIERRPVIHPRDPADRGRTPDPAGPITCEQCGVQLRDLRLYAQHFRRAHPDKNRTKYPAMKTPCMCEQCGKIFQSMALLKDHMWVHTGEKRFKCDRCSKSFTQKTNLVFHMRVHSANRPSYECPLCGKHFAFYNNRRRHMFIHTGLKPFKCETCGKCFTTAGEQRSHLEHVHLKKPWPKRPRHRHADHDAWRHKCHDLHTED